MNLDYLSPSLVLLNCSPIMQAKVGPTKAPLTGSSSNEPTYMSIASKI